MHVQLKHKDVGNVVDTKLGFSWTTLFFGVFPAFFRGDWKWGLIMTGLAIITVGISHFVFIFVYNKLYIKDLLHSGYVPANETSQDVLKAKGLVG